MSNRPGRKASRTQSTTKKSRQIDDSSSNTTTWLVGLGVVGAIVLAVVIAFAIGGDDSSTDKAQVGRAAIVGDPLPSFDSAAADPAVGLLAPAIEAQDFDDNPVEVEPGDGTAKIIGFFAHWCPHCQSELPRLQSWIDDNGVPEGVEIVAVSTSVDEGGPNYPPSEWFEDEGWTEVLARDSHRGAVANGYGLSSFPYFVVVDTEGNVIGRTSGALSTEQWEAVVELAIAGAGDTTGIGGGQSSPSE